MKVIITGGSGLIGGILTPALIAQGHTVTILTRRPVLTQEFPPNFKIVRYDPLKSGQWQEKIAESEVIINLAGLSIFRRWTFLSKQAILKSRLVTTRKVVEALSFRQNQEKTLLSISGAGIYGPHGDEVLVERDAAGEDFLARLAQQWEAVAESATQFGIRVVLCRIGNVLSLKGGMLPKLVMLAKYHLESRWGTGQQWGSWIHETDLAEAFMFLIENGELAGPVNITAPEPVRNAELMKLISKHAHGTPWLPYLPAPLLRLAAGEMASVFLTGQRVVPRKLLDAGFRFRYPTLEEALGQLWQEPMNKHQ